MKDERIIKELNKTKIIIIYYIFITTLLVFLGKFLINTIYLETFNFFLYSVELFIILVSLILLLIRFVMFSQSKDERIEENYEKIGNILFTIMFFGSFFIHFLTVAYNQSLNIVMYNFTSTFFLIGIIILVYQLWYYVKKTDKLKI